MSLPVAVPDSAIRRGRGRGAVLLDERQEDRLNEIANRERASFGAVDAG